MPRLTESWITLCFSSLIHETLSGKEVGYVLPISSVLGTEGCQSYGLGTWAPSHTNIAQSCAVASIVSTTILQGQTLPLEAGMAQSLLPNVYSSSLCQASLSWATKYVLCHWQFLGFRLAPRYVN